MRGNDAAIGPALHCRMALMTQLGCHRADATEAGDDLSGIHASNVQMTCTSVNMEYVRTDRLNAPMAADGIIGAKLRKLTDRAGLKGDALAVACGWKGRNGPQQYFARDEPLSHQIALKFAKGIVGRGSPPITFEEVLSLTEQGDAVLGDLIARAAPPPQLQMPNEEDLAVILRVLAPYVSEALGHEDDFPALARFLHTAAKWRLQEPDAPVRELEAAVTALALQKDDRNRPPA